VRDIQYRQGVKHFRVKGKRDKVRFIPVHAAAQRLIEEYLALAGHADDATGPVFRPVTNNRTGELDRPLDPGSVYTNIVQKYGLTTGLCTEATRLRVHSLRATAAINALSHEADIAKCRSGSATPTSPPRASMIGVRRGRKIAPPSGCDTEKCPMNRVDGTQDFLRLAFFVRGEAVGVTAAFCASTVVTKRAP
jgi:hypothetical protein